jgi:RimJ/RimL family protein N-acetyltransferase
MEAIKIRPLSELDLPFVGQVRHDPETLVYLHDQRVFSDEQMQTWFRTERPEWYIVEADKLPVGYLRTSARDRRNSSIKVGCDIHPAHRRRGFARAAFGAFFERLKWEGVHRVWLEVLPTNTGAVALYEGLGFLHEGRLAKSVRLGNRWLDSLVMGRAIMPETGLNAKVIAVYLGPRRQRPPDSRGAYELLCFLLEREISLDPGCHSDTILVYNKDAVPYGGEADLWVARAERLLAGADGQATKRGRFRLLIRENMGLSFGAFNHAFTHLMADYDNWFFSEDDQVVVQDGCFGLAIAQLQADPSVGFVAVVGVSHDPLPHAHGGVGVTTRSVLRQVLNANRCGRHPFGHLPYHWERGYHRQELDGEVRFTNAIHREGFRLVNLSRDDVCVSWGDPWKRTSRMIPWQKAMVGDHPLLRDAQWCAGAFCSSDI